MTVSMGKLNKVHVRYAKLILVISA